jgi:hypothetical protein
MKQIETAVGEDYRLSFRSPAAPQLEKFRAIVQRRHRFSVASQVRKKTGTPRSNRLQLIETHGAQQ